MKNFIILCAIIPLLLFFPLQFAVNQVNHYRMMAMQNIVHKSAQQARSDGYFTVDNKNSMKQQIKDAFGVDEGDIIMSLTESRKVRKNVFDEREMISYTVQVPIKKIIAAPGLFGISDADNQTLYSVKGQVPSEALP